MRTADHYFEAMPFSEITHRETRTCRHCKRVPEVHPPSPHLPRDRDDEVQIQDYAASLAPRLQESAKAFALARTRAAPGPVMDADSRDNAREIREEIADAINYVTWEIQRLDRGGGSETQKMGWEHALIKAVELWDAVTVAEQREG